MDFLKMLKTYKIAAEARDYQGRIVDKTVDNLLKGDSTMIESPTGSGKTTMGMSAMKIMGHKNPGMKFGWCTMRRTNLTQVERENEEKNFNLDMVYISMFDKNPPKVDMLMVDEGHHDATTSMNNIHTKCKPKYLIAASATLARTDRASLFFRKTVRDANIRNLIKAGYLSKYNHFSLPSWDPSLVAKAYTKDKAMWGKSVMFFRTMDECEEAAIHLKKSKIRFDIVTGETDKEKQIELFRQGKLDLLVNMMVLTEGFDFPELSTVFVRPSTKSPTLQMAGRVLRLHKGMTKNIVQSANTHYEFIKEAEASDRKIQYHNGLWVPVVTNNEKKLDEFAFQSLESLSTLITKQLETEPEEEV